MLIQIGVVLVAMLVLGAVLGVLIGLVAKKFEVKSDPRIEQVLEQLPGANCGGCGFAGCADFAKALVSGAAKDPGKCPASSAQAVQAISELLGFVTEPGVKKVAFVRCAGSRSVAQNAVQYNGVCDCKSAMLVQAGNKGCHYGCLGLASCVRACPFNAIEVREGLAVVHPELCVGCGKCVETCPRHLIELVPQKRTLHIYCNNPEKGALKRCYCSVACIGCRKCEKAVEPGQITMRGALAVIDYTNAPSADLAEKIGCPTHAIHVSDDIRAGGIEQDKKENEA